MNKQMNILKTTWLLLIVATVSLAPFPLLAEDVVKVTADNYVRAETDY